jgi:hypothetical protein
MRRAVTIALLNGFGFRLGRNDGKLRQIRTSRESPPRFSTVRIRWLEKLPGFIGFFALLA